MAGHLHSSNGRFSENAKAWFAAGSHRSLVEMAKIDHVMFKKRVMDVLMGRDTWPVADVPDHHNCRLGKWYDAITTADIKALPAYAKLVAPHQRVHAAGIRAIAAHGEGDIDGALAALKDLNDASIEVLAILEEMSQALSGRLAHLDAATPRATAPQTPAAGAPAPHSHGSACCGGKH
jgi:methyl-accepting chemotaxis protein